MDKEAIGEMIKYVSAYLNLPVIQKPFAWLAFYKKYRPREKMGQLKLDGGHLERLWKDYYYVSGYFHVSYPDGKSVNGRFSELMKKIKGKWYLYTDHSS